MNGLEAKHYVARQFHVLIGAQNLTQEDALLIVKLKEFLRANNLHVAADDIFGVTVCKVNRCDFEPNTLTPIVNAICL